MRPAAAVAAAVLAVAGCGGADDYAIGPTADCLRDEGIPARVGGTEGLRAVPRAQGLADGVISITGGLILFADDGAAAEKLRDELEAYARGSAPDGQLALHLERDRNVLIQLTAEAADVATIRGCLTG